MDMLKGLLYCLAALAIRSLPGSDISYGKQYIRQLVNKLLKAKDCDSEIEKRKHKYDSMEY